MFDNKEPVATGYLIIGSEHYHVDGKWMSDIRMHLDIAKTGESDEQQKDLFEET